MEPETDRKMDDAVETVLRERAAELEEEFQSRLRQLRVDLVKARQQILFLEKGCDAAESAARRAKTYAPIIAKEYECPNCFVRMGVSGTLYESPQVLAEDTMTCRKCGTGFRIPGVVREK